ncbi:unnamed protein product [Leptosia nina]|uniref:Secreted protein n=1 Tax=Leptosia nina TaxID=320188 RepID=A0AAV1JTY2_9NEOP
MCRFSLFVLLLSAVLVLAEDPSSSAAPSSSPAPITPATATATTPKPSKPDSLLSEFVNAALDIPKGVFNACTDFKKLIFGW